MGLSQQSEKRLKTSTDSSGPLSGESEVRSTQNASKGRRKAEQWFNDANGRPSQVPFVDNDPPYYMPKESSSEENIASTSNGRVAPRHSSRIGPTAPTQSLLAQMNAHNDNTDDFRSVIDDLTIQNRKLKKRLKKYEKLHCSHLQEEKLFEVRIHGLDAARKQELEQQLRSFASSIEGNSPSTRHEVPTQVPVPGPADNKPSSSSTSLSKPQDSGYASMSGHTGISQPHTLDMLANDSQTAPPKRQNIKSYLLDIPENLAPQPPLAISERSKRKLVVKRLEQLFTGRGAAKGRQSQSEQQQEVSQSAAQADRRRIEAGGMKVWQEGTREAHILPGDANLHVDPGEDSNGSAQRSRGSNEGSRSRSTQGSQVSGSPRSPEQRPTRPLDLDIHRAQIPSDNIEYIRHLGLVSPADDPSLDNDGDDGWVYLNLLTSMAQLHTLNVTPEFVRKAISDVSEKFELSPDGSKVRWLGGNEGTRMSSDSGESEETPRSNWNASDPSLSASKRGSFADNSSREELPLVNDGNDKATPAIAARRKQPVDLTQATTEGGEFHYRPLFVHAGQSEESDNSGLSSDSLESSDGQDLKAGANSGSHALQERESRLHGRRRDDGPIIFYNRARFCTDLSGDLSGARSNNSMYRRLTEQPLGAPPNASDESNTSGDDGCSPARSSMEMSSDKSKTGRSALDMEDLKSSISDCMSVRGSATAMEASGIGGVWPEDNFVVKVKVRHGKSDKAKKMQSPRRLTAFSKPKGPIRKILHNLSQKSVDAFHEVSSGSLESTRTQPQQSEVKAEILSTMKTNMPPSSLPPPSYVHSGFSSSASTSDEIEEGDESNDQLDADMSSSSNIKPRSRGLNNQRDAYPGHPLLRNSQTHPHMQNYAAPNLPRSASALPHPLYQNYTPRNLENDYPSSSSKITSAASGSDDSSSIDLLAHARELDPELVAAREQEFERNIRGSGHASLAGMGPGRGGNRLGSGAQTNLGLQHADEADVLEVPIPHGSVAATVGGESVAGNAAVQRQQLLPPATSGAIPPAEGDGDEDEDDETSSEADSMSVVRESESGGE